MITRNFSSLLVLIAVLFSGSAFARPTPVKRDVQLKSSAFAELIYKALDLRLERRTPDDVKKWEKGMRIYIQVAEGLKCEKFIRRGIWRSPAPLYTCWLLKNAGWNRLGDKAYGSGKSERMSVALFEALNVKSVKLADDSDTLIKTIELNEEDERGGTERNLLSCALPSEEDARLGLVPNCQIIDAL